MNFYFIIVIYNQFVKNSEFLKLVDSSNNLFFFVVDNSTNSEIKKDNKSFSNNIGINYIDMNGNFGISKAYNTAIQNIPKINTNWIILLDQDTKLDITFLSNYKQSIVDHPDKLIFVPIIRDSKGIMSPARRKNIKFLHSKFCDYNKNIFKYSFINSCMCINSCIFKDIKYDDNLFLDYIDHDFIRTVNFKMDNVIFVINNFHIFQNFSGVSNNSLDSDLTRFRIFRTDLSYYTHKWKENFFRYYYIIYTRAIKLSLIHKNIIFLGDIND